jgi:hypothetical protein
MPGPMAVISLPVKTPLITLIYPEKRGVCGPGVFCEGVQRSDSDRWFFLWAIRV